MVEDIFKLLRITKRSFASAALRHSNAWVRGTSESECLFLALI